MIVEFLNSIKGSLSYDNYKDYYHKDRGFREDAENIKKDFEKIIGKY